MRGKNRGIIFKLHNYRDKVRIWDSRSKLKGSSIWLAENFPAEIEQRRQILTPILKAAWKLEKKATLSVDRLRIDGIEYTVNTLDKLPAELDPRKIATPQKDDVTVFFGAASPLSNFHKTEIKDQDGLKFTSSEQMYQYHKAMHFNDDTTAAKIRSSRTPLEAYKLGFQVKGFSDSEWYKKNAVSAMQKCCMLKFTQNESLKFFLLGTDDSTIAEGSVKDRQWGVGLSIHDDKIFNTDNWQGENWMGDILMRIRNELCDN